MKMTYAEIDEIVAALKLFNKSTSVEWYGICKNINIGKHLLKKRETIINDARKQFCECDEQGNPIVYVLTKKGEIARYKQEDMASYVIHPRNGPNVQFKFKSHEDEIAFGATLSAMNKDSFDVTWHKIPSEKLKETEVRGDVNATDVQTQIDYGCLIETIFVDEAPSQSPPKGEKSKKK